MEWFKKRTAASVPSTSPGSGYGGVYVNSTDGLPHLYDTDTSTDTSLAGLVSFNGRTTAAAVPTSGDYAVAQVTGAAPLANPALTGTPTAPTASPGANSTQLATTAYADAAAIAAAVGLLDYRGTYNASTNLFPASGGSGAAGAVLKGDFWVVSTPGTLGGTAVSNGDLVIALVDSPAQTAVNWDLVEHDIGYAPESAANKSTDGTMAANSATLYPSQSAAKTYVDAKVENAITSGHTTIAPSGDSVFTALALKAPLAAPTFTGAVKASGTFSPKDVEGTVYIDTANSQGWAGSDPGAWFNSAYAYLKTTYGSNGSGGPTFGGWIEIGPGLFTATTPAVACTQYFTIGIRGHGDGATTSNANGGTMWNYTPTTGIAFTLGGASNNTGGVQIQNINIQGAGSGNATTGIKWGLLGSSSTAGATATNVAIQGFGTGEAWETNTQIAYAVTHINCKTQFCGTGAKPFGEANNWFGGLIGGNATGIDGSNTGTDAMFFGTAFDDNTTTALNVSNATFRTTVSGCRFENAGGGTDTYITQSAGSVIVLGGSMQSDIISATVSTGFGQLSGGDFTLRDTWLLGQGSRTFTQAFNCSGTVIARITPRISQSSVGITTIMQTGFTDQGMLNVLNGTVAIPTTTETLVLNARLPANAPTAAQVYEWRAVVITAGANVGTWRVRTGTAGTTADATVANIVVTAAGFANGRSIYEGTLEVRTSGGSGTAEAEGHAVTNTAANAAAVAGTTAAAATTTAFVTTSAIFLDITYASPTSTATAVQAYIKAL